MDFFDILEKRKTNFAWSEVEVDKAEIISIIKRVISLVPSKQNKQPYRIDLLDWSNPDLRLQLFRAVHREETHNEEEDQGNPQVLAPILLVFSSRNPNSDTRKSLDKISARDLDKESRIEIGIVSASIIYALTEAGYDTGYCGCFTSKVHGLDKEIYGTDYTEELLDLDYLPIVLLGIGKKSNKETYFDPRVNKEKPLPTHGTNNIKPNKDKILFLHNDETQ